jgi:hypothetical protein
MTATVHQVRANPSRFRIPEVEIARREQFLAESFKDVDEIEMQMNGQTSNQRMQFHVSSFQPIAPVPVASTRDLGGPVNELQLEAHQEEQIDRIAESVRVQKHIGKQIVTTLDEQHEMIIELEAGVDNAQTAMKKVTQQIVQLIDNEGRVPTYLVAILSVVLILMLWWVA